MGIYISVEVINWGLMRAMDAKSGMGEERVGSGEWGVGRVMKRGNGSAK